MKGVVTGHPLLRSSPEYAGQGYALNAYLLRSIPAGKRGWTLVSTLEVEQGSYLVRTPGVTDTHAGDIPAGEVQSALVRGGLGKDRETESGDGLKLDPTDAAKDGT